MSPYNVHQLPLEMQAALFKQRQQQAMQNMPQGMDVAQKYLWAMANHISPANIGLTSGQIYASEQGLTGYAMNPQTGQVTKANAYGGRDAVDPKSLLSTINTNLGGSFGQENGQTVADASWAYGSPGSYNVTPGSSSFGTGRSGVYGGGNGVSNIGGGAGNPNNAAGGLYGSAGNAVRQQMMDSQQFNPNGANTYAIQNMNLTGQGSLGSNMGGMAGTTYPSQSGASTAVGNGSTSGAVMPSTSPTPPASSYSTTTAPTTGTGVMTPQTSPTGARTPGYFNSGSTAAPAPSYSTTPTPTTPQNYSSAGAGVGLRNGMVRQ